MASFLKDIPFDSNESSLTGIHLEQSESKNLLADVNEILNYFLADESKKLKEKFSLIGAATSATSASVNHWFFGSDGISKRARNCLSRKSVNSIELLLDQRIYDLMSIPNFGVGSLRSVIGKLVDLDKNFEAILIANSQASINPHVILDVSNGLRVLESWGTFLHPELGLRGWLDLVDSGQVPDDVELAMSHLGAHNLNMANMRRHSIGRSISHVAKYLDPRIIVVLRYRIWALDVKTLDSVGTTIGVTRERVRQLQTLAHEDLTSLLDGENLQLAESFGGPLLTWFANWARMQLSPSLTSESVEVVDFLERFCIESNEEIQDLVLCGICGYWKTDTGWTRIDGHAENSVWPMHASEVRESLKRGVNAELVRKKVNRVVMDLVENPGSSVDEIGSRIGMTASLVMKQIPQTLRKLVLNHRDWQSLEWSDEQILESIQLASTYEFPLSSPRYKELVQSGEIKGPSVPTIFNRFGSWTHACDLAQVEKASGGHDNYVPRWTTNELREFILSYLIDPITTGSFEDYGLWAKGHGDAPSPGTMRKYFGSWREAKRDVLHGIWRDRVSIDLDTLLPFQATARMQ